jgi:LacI family transcriptional regulator
VSKSTVSLVLQGSPLVKDETARSVREAMRDIGYVYNRAAAKLLRGSSVGLVGLVINDLRNPFFANSPCPSRWRWPRGAMPPWSSNSDEDDGLQEKLVGSMIEHGVDAVVISPAYGDPPIGLRSAGQGRAPGDAGAAPDG